MTNEWNEKKELNQEQEEVEEEVKEVKYPYTEESETDDGFKKIILYFKEKEVYEFKEKPFRIFKKIQKQVTTSDGNVNSGDMITKLVSVSLVKPSMKDAEIDELPTSKAIALASVITKLYNIKGLENDFS